MFNRFVNYSFCLLRKNKILNSEKSYLQIPSISKEHLEFLVLSSTDDFCFGSTYGQKFDKNENPFAKKK